MEPLLNNDPTEPMLGSQNSGKLQKELRARYAKLETSYRWRIIFYLNVFLACVSFSIILPSLWPYLQHFGVDENFLALVLGIYSFGEFVGAIIWGYIYNATSMKMSIYS